MLRFEFERLIGRFKEGEAGSVLHLKECVKHPCLPTSFRFVDVEDMYQRKARSLRE